MHQKGKLGSPGCTLTQIVLRLHLSHQSCLPLPFPRNMRAPEMHRLHYYHPHSTCQYHSRPIIAIPRSCRSHRHRPWHILNCATDDAQRESCRFVQAILRNCCLSSPSPNDMRLDLLIVQENCRDRRRYLPEGQAARWYRKWSLCSASHRVHSGEKKAAALARLQTRTRYRHSSGGSSDSWPSPCRAGRRQPGTYPPLCVS